MRLRAYFWGRQVLDHQGPSAGRYHHRPRESLGPVGLRTQVPLGPKTLGMYRNFD